MEENKQLTGAEALLNTTIEKSLVSNGIATFDDSPEDTYLTNELQDDIRVAADTETTEEDLTDYTCKDPHILFEKKKFLQIVSQLTSIIDLGAKKAVSRGVTLRVIDETKLEVIMPNDMYYFKAELKLDNCTLQPGTSIFIEYSFIQKMTKFFLPKILISTKMDKSIQKYYIKLTTTDKLELLNTQLIESDLKKLDNQYEIVGDALCEVSLDELSNALTSLSGILNFESDSPRRILSSSNGKITFKSSLIFASSDVKFLDMQLRKNEIAYLIRASQLAKDKTLKVYNTNSELTRYIFEYGNTQLMTNFAKANDDTKIRELLNDLPDMTVIDYSKLKYQLDYANSITYALGTLTLRNDDGVLSSMIKLTNGSEAPFIVPTISAVTIPKDEKIRVNTKTLLGSLNSLDSSLETSIGYKNGIIYIKNSDVTLMLVSV